MRFWLRDYVPADFRTLWIIDQTCFSPGIAYTQFELKTYINRSTSFTLVAEVEEPGYPLSEATRNTALLKSKGPPLSPLIMGFLVAERGRSEGHIITIDVRAEARKQRVGSTLLAAAEERLRLWNCRRLRLETAVDNTAALSFYKAHAYSVTKVVPRYYSSGVDALVLEKDLLSSSGSVNVQRQR